MKVRARRVPHDTYSMSALYIITRYIINDRADLPRSGSRAIARMVGVCDPRHDRQRCSCDQQSISVPEALALLPSCEIRSDV
jgi:hypothetical protein